MKKHEKILLLSDLFGTVADQPAKAKTLNTEDFKNAARYLCEYAKILCKGEEMRKLSKVNTKWTEKEDEKLKSEYAKGWRTARLAKAHSRSLSGIVSRLVKLGLLEDDGENGNKRWTPEEDAILLCEAEKNATLETMASNHKRSMSGILSRLEKLGYNIDERK